MEEDVMTALFRCDACDLDMPDDAPRIALEVVKAIESEVEVEGDGFSELISMTSTLSFGFNGDHHFCSMGCLSSWAMGKAIDDAVTS